MGGETLEEESKDLDESGERRDETEIIASLPRPWSSVSTIISEEVLIFISA